MSQSHNPFCDMTYSVLLEAPETGHIQPVMLNIRFVPTRSPSYAGSIDIKVVGAQNALTGRPINNPRIRDRLARSKQFKEALASFKWAIENEPDPMPDGLVEMLREIAESHDM